MMRSRIQSRCWKQNACKLKFLSCCFCVSLKETLIHAGHTAFFLENQLPSTMSNLLSLEIWYSRFVSIKLCMRALLLNMYPISLVPGHLELGGKNYQELPMSVPSV